MRPSQTPMVNAFRRWKENADQAALRGSASLGVWLLVAVVIIPCLYVAAYLPSFASFFELDFPAALAVFAPVFVNGALFSLLNRNRTHFRWWGWLMLIVGSGLLKFFCASLIAISAPRASVVFSTLVLLACTYHGHLNRVTLREPFMALASVAALLAAYFLAPSPEHRAIFLIIGPSAIVAEFVAGTAAARQVESARQQERMKAAINAQMLAHQNSEVRRLSGTIVDLLGHSHDINNALTSAVLSVESLQAVAEQREAPAEVMELLGELEETMTHIRQAVDDVRGMGREAAESSLEMVEPAPIVRSVVSAAKQRFPSTRIDVADQMSDGTAFFIRGGGVNLRRIVENLVINACEGSGTKGASHVVVRLRQDATGANAELVVEDDGPGFPLSMLERPIDAFHTSKEKGTGLGLYTTEKLVQASGGNLERFNRVEGGACVRVLVPLAGAVRLAA